MAVDPLYYLVQLILFPVAAILFGVSLHALWREIETHGWVLTARCVWRICLTLSSFAFCIMELDPTSVLGILPTAWRNEVESIASGLLFNSACSTFYMYIIVLSKRHLTKGKVPPLFTNVWVAANTSATIGTFFSGLVGAITNSGFWLGIAIVILTLQEIAIGAIVHYSLHKMTKLLAELETQSSVTYNSQRRKLWIIRIIATALICIDITNEFTKAPTPKQSPTLAPRSASTPKILTVIHQ